MFSLIYASVHPVQSDWKTDISVCRIQTFTIYDMLQGKKQVEARLLKMEKLTDSNPLFYFPRMLQDRGMSSQPGLLERILELKETHCSPYLLAFLFDCYEDALESSNQKENVEEEEQKETLKRALEVRNLSVRDQGYFVLEIN